MEGFCPRLVDYILFVGTHSPNCATVNSQAPVILNRFPPLDHKDFLLPPDVAYFCQPEGCFNTTSWTDLQESMFHWTPDPFVFTITDKESGKVRYGVCYNFFRHIPRLDSDQTNFTHSATEPMQSDLTITEPTSTETSNISAAPGRLTHTLTSLCLISHHPFFSHFKLIIEFLHSMIQRLHKKSQSELSKSDTVWDVLTCSSSTAASPLVIRSVYLIESWMLRLLSVPSPIPGKTYINVSIHSKCMTNPLIFAHPDKSRLPLFDFPLHLPIQLLGVARSLRILVCLLMEQKVVLQSSDYNKLSICVMALVTLLYPLQYMFPVIPLLPPCMPDAEQLLIAPTPYLIGVPTSFYSARKVFRMPKDVWLANLDTQELSYPEVMEDVPDIPEPECNHLVNQFNRLLSSVSSTPGVSPSGSTLPTPTRAVKIRGTATLPNPSTQPVDEASASVATRVAMVLFLLSKNILGGLSEHTRTLRLYPRPVVALQFENFMKSRPVPSLFTHMLAKTQAVEYFAESSVFAQNDAYQRIKSGEYSPELIGDKPHWFLDLLTPISFDMGCGLSSSGINVYSNGECSDVSLSDTEGEGTSTPLPSSSAIITSPDVNCEHTETPSKTLSAANVSDTVGVISALSHDVQSSIPHLESVVCRPGLPIPSILAVHFRPPTQMILPTPSISMQSADRNEALSLADSSNHVFPQTRQADGNIPFPFKTTEMVSQKRYSTSAYPTMTTSQTLRTLRTLSMSALPPGSLTQSTGDSQPGGMLNWNSPFALLLDGVFTLGNHNADASAKYGSSVKERRKRLEEERYLDQLARSIKQGDTPGIFSRNYIVSLFDLECNRNLLLSRLNLTYSDLSSEHQNSSELEDVAITTWNQYKAMVWALRKIASGVAHNLRPDLTLSTSTSPRIDNNRPPPLISSGGLASAFSLLEIAHTHYFPLPVRQMQSSSRGSQAPTRSSSVSQRFSDPSTSHNNEPSYIDVAAAHSTGAHSPVATSAQYDRPLMVSPEGSVTHNSTLDQLDNHLADLAIESCPHTQADSAGTCIADTQSDASSELRSSSEYTASRSNTVKIFVDASVVSGPKSSLSRGYRYRQSKLFLSPCFAQSIDYEPDASYHLSPGITSNLQLIRDTNSAVQRDKRLKVGRTYLFEDLFVDHSTRAKLWDNLQFWEDAFLDAVAQERDIHGMDFRPTELLVRYNTASSSKRKHLEMEEDQLLAGLMHNMIAFMVMVDVDRTAIRRKIRRLLAKSHMGLRYSQQITDLLDALDLLYGNDIDLKPLQSRSIPGRSYEVYRESDATSEPLFIEVCKDFLLLRNILGGILERWWYDQLINLSYRLHTRILCISIRNNEYSSLNIFYTNKCQTLYQEIRGAMEKGSFKTSHEMADLKDEIDVISLDTNCSGTIRLCNDGFCMRFNDQETSVAVPCIKRCSTPQHDLFMIEYFDSHEKRLQTLRFQTDMAASLLYHFHVLIADFSTRLKSARPIQSPSIASNHSSGFLFSYMSGKTD